MNDAKAIAAAFKDYYRTTLLRDETDRNKLRRVSLHFPLDSPGQGGMAEAPLRPADTGPAALTGAAIGGAA